jgi:hypothetical protein
VTSCKTLDKKREPETPATELSDDKIMGGTMPCKMHDTEETYFVEGEQPKGVQTTKNSQYGGDKNTVWSKYRRNLSNVSNLGGPATV